MQIAAKESRTFIGKAPYLIFAADDTATRKAAFYQQIAIIGLNGAIRNGQIDAERLVAFGEMAHRRRQTEVVELVSRLLKDLPLGKRYEQAARYFDGLCLYRRKDYAQAKIVFENLLLGLHGKLKARVAMALAAVYHDSKEESSTPYYLQASAIAAENWCDPYTVVQVGRMTAVHKSLEGDHQGAVSNLERLIPVAKTISRTSPFLFLDVLNSYAVEKGEVGRFAEALEISRFVLASPLAAAYPEWKETRAELVERGRRASGSFVRLDKAIVLASNVVPLPAQASPLSRPDDGSPGRLLNFKLPEKNMPQNNPKPFSTKALEDLPIGEKQNFIMKTVLDEDTDEALINDMMAWLLARVQSKPKDDSSSR